MNALKILVSLLSCTLTVLSADSAQLKPTEALFFDEARQREIPVVIYPSSNGKDATKLAVISGGNGMASTAYGFLANMLVVQGYLVVSVQHQLPSDAPLAMSGDIYALRRPMWERSAANLRFVLSSIKRDFPHVDPSQTLLIGHSNGGDISTLFATLHPAEVAVVITLDHRRMAIPRTRQPHFLTLRADEFPADPGVLPNPDEAKRLVLSIVELKNTKHGDLSDYGNDALKVRVTSLIAEFLRQLPPAPAKF